jgi:hypothetical protein
MHVVATHEIEVLNRAGKSRQSGKNWSQVHKGEDIFGTFTTCRFHGDRHDHIALCNLRVIPPNDRVVSCYALGTL